MSTLSEISKAIQEIRQLLSQSLTPEFFRSIKSACDSISRILNDPNVSQNIKDGLAQLNKLLKEANDRGLIEEIVKLTAEIHKKLAEFDIPAFNKIVSNFGELLEQANNAQFIEKIVDVLKSAKSIGEFFEVAKNFLGDSKTVLTVYGPCAAILGVALNKALSVYLKTNNDAHLIKLSEENNQLLALIGNVNIQQLRLEMSKTYAKLSVNLNQGVYDFDPELRNHMITERDHALIFVRTIPFLKPDTIYSLALLDKKLENLILKFAESEIKNEKIDDYLDGIGKGYEHYWLELLNYIVYSNKLISLKALSKPNLSRHERNYRSICRIYGEVEINAIMLGLAANFSQNGGNDLYYQLANGMADSAGFFLILMQYLTQTTSSLEQSIYFTPATKLQTYFHENANRYISDEWQKIKWPVGLEQLEFELDTTTIDIIRVRAFAEFCKNTARYFFGVYPLPRELFNGVLDVPRGIWQTVRHPVQTLQGFGSLFTSDGWTNIGRSIWYHPVRFLTPALITGACNYGVGHISKALPHPHASAHLPLLKSTMPVTSIKSTAVSASLVPSSLVTPSIVSVASSEETIQQLEMTTPVKKTEVEQSSFIQLNENDWDKLWKHLMIVRNPLEKEIDSYKLIHDWYIDTIREKNAGLSLSGTSSQHRFFNTEPLKAGASNSLVPHQ